MAKASNIYIILLVINAIKYNDEAEGHLIISSSSSSSLCNAHSRLQHRSCCVKTLPHRKGISLTVLPYQKSQSKLKQRKSSWLTTRNSNHCARRFHDPMSQQGLQLMPESSQGSEQDNKKRDAATNFPKIVFGLGGVDDAGNVHSVVGGEEGEWKKDDRYDCEDKDGFVLAVRHDR